jgi:intracellular sulfur oxidation DsrE/DsrF family protein
MQKMINYLKKAFSHKLNMVSYQSGIRVFSSGSNHGKRKSLSGSMTIEAALAMPIFLFFMLSVLYIFQIINVQAETYQELHQRGNRKAFSAYKDRDQYDDGIIKLTESYRIKPFLWWQDFGRLRVTQQYYGYAWIGYDVSRSGEVNDEDKEYVYIAETGTVYHITMDCSHLKLSVTSVDNSTISSLRNDSGAKYYQCERCPSDGSTVLFITTFGTRYHTDVNCSGLKRTVSMLLKNEAISQGYRGCSRCA